MKPPQMNIFVLDRFISWGPRFGPGTETKIWSQKTALLGGSSCVAPVRSTFQAELDSMVPSVNPYGLWHGRSTENFCLELGFPAESLEPTGMRERGTPCGDSERGT